MKPIKRAFKDLRIFEDIKGKDLKKFQEAYDCVRTQCDLEGTDGDGALIIEAGQGLEFFENIPILSFTYQETGSLSFGWIPDAEELQNILNRVREFKKNLCRGKNIEKACEAVQQLDERSPQLKKVKEKFLQQLKLFPNQKYSKNMKIIDEFSVEIVNIIERIGFKEAYSTEKAQYAALLFLGASQMIGSSSPLALSKFLTMSRGVQDKYLKEVVQELLIQYYRAISPNGEEAVSHFRTDFDGVSDILALLKKVQEIIIAPVERRFEIEKITS